MTLDIKWNPSQAVNYQLTADSLHEVHPSFNALDTPFLVATGIRELTLKSHTDIKIVNSNVHKVFKVGSSDMAITFNDALLDTGSIQAGKNYYIYLCDRADGTAEIKASLNSTYPAGYTADSSRQIGGLHTLCVAVGTISGHPLTGFVAGDILPQSVWCRNHRPVSEPEGMVFSQESNVWVDIYLQSGTGATTASANGGTITDTRPWFDHVDDMAAVSKRLLREHEFQTIAAGSNEETNINGSADPVTTGGHSDTASRRMISDIGCEDCCGALWQWTLTPQARLDNGTAAIWINLPGARGSYYTYGTNGYGNTRLLAGGDWHSGTTCGSRARSADSYPWYTASRIAGRGCARSRNT